jgi:hypothetical protein
MEFAHPANVKQEDQNRTAVSGSWMQGTREINATKINLSDKATTVQSMVGSCGIIVQWQLRHLMFLHLIS